MSRTLKTHDQEIVLENSFIDRENREITVSFYWSNQINIDQIQGHIQIISMDSQNNFHADVTLIDCYANSDLLGLITLTMRYGSLATFKEIIPNKELEIDWKEFGF